MKKEIIDAIRDIEKTREIKILYACESGSRAWGFPSPDSDYDVRFIYVHPLEWYLRVTPGTDNIDLPKYSELLDFQGWDVRKALGLLSKGNPTLLEWLHSPIIYEQQGNLHSELMKQVPSWFSSVRAHYHYYSMAKKNFETCLRGESVRLKKYFYVIRPLLCVQWIAEKKTVPPLLFETLVSELVVDPVVLEAIEALLARKRRVGEAQYGEPIPVLQAWIENKLAQYGSNFDALKVNTLPLVTTPEKLDDLLYRTVCEWQLHKSFEELEAPTINQGEK